MLKMLLLSAVCSLLLHVSFGQNHTAHLSVGVNPLSIAESEFSAGPCAGFRFNDRFGVWTEVSYIFGNSYMPKNWKHLRGMRFIFQPRFYTSKQTFIATEFRYKNYSFNNTGLLINRSTADSITDLPYKENQMLIGGAFLVGHQIYFSKQKRMFLEITFGIGAKDRRIKRTGIPQGYKIDQPVRVDGGFSINYEEELKGRVYVPFGLRFMWSIR